MAIISWNEAYSVGVSEIDTQHKELISIINELYEAHQMGTGQIVVQETLNKLFEYTNYHFTMEQQMHSEYKYPGASKQIEEHKEFVATLDNLKQKAENSNLLLTLKTLDLLKDWMITHILGSDKAFGDYLRNTGMQ
jgi:hemerythrin-like metal-binding protein